MLLVLLVCLATMAVVQALGAVALCATGELRDEAAGRARLLEKDRGLTELRYRALLSWQESGWDTVDSQSERVDGSIMGVPGSEWVLLAEVRQNAAVSLLRASAWLERGRDGIDLPLAAVAASAVDSAPTGETPWLQLDAGAAATFAAEAYLVDDPPPLPLGEGCSVDQLPAPWRLDLGWQRWASEWAGGSQASLASVAPGPGVVVLHGRRGQSIGLAGEIAALARGETAGAVPGSTSEVPLLVVCTGGADVDACDLGDLYGVLVVDGGSVWLRGTALHGAVFATGRVELGVNGQVLFSRPLLRWATDRSLARARLVPGSRGEGTD